MTFLNNSKRAHLSARTQPNMLPNMSNTVQKCSTYLVTYLSAHICLPDTLRNIFVAYFKACDYLVKENKEDYVFFVIPRQVFKTSFKNNISTYN